MLYSIGQLYLAGDRPQDSVKTFEQWIAIAPEVKSSHLSTLAIANYRAKNFGAAINYGVRAFKPTESPSDRLILTLISSHTALQQHESARRYQAVLRKTYRELGAVDWSKTSTASSRVPAVPLAPGR